MKGCRDCNSAKTSATRNCLYGVVVVNDVSLSLHRFLPKRGHRNRKNDVGRDGDTTVAEKCHLPIRILISFFLFPVSTFQFFACAFARLCMEASSAGIYSQGVWLATPIRRLCVGYR